MTHNYLHELHDSLNDTPAQRKFRALAPMPVGAVFLPWPGMSEDDVRHHLRTMKRLGFTCLKQVMGLPPQWRPTDLYSIALDEGIIPWWYAEAGYEEPTPELLAEIGLPPEMDLDSVLAHPDYLARQERLMRQRIARQREAEDENEQASRTASRKQALRIPSVFDFVDATAITPEATDAIIAWLQDHYGTVEALKAAWNSDHVGLGDHTHCWQSWDQVRAGLHTEVPLKDFRHLRDLMRMRADQRIEGTRRKSLRQTDPHEPQRDGGEMGLFLPFAANGIDMEGIASAIAESGSFYPSIHLAWHFDEVEWEVARPMYMQTQIATGWAKGVWTASWESTGGPQAFTGEKLRDRPELRHQTPGFTVDEHTMTQLMLTWLAGGFKGFGIWTWNMRTAGWEAGQFALTDRNMEPTPRAERVGLIGRRARELRREIWESHGEPLVGILADWDNHATWAALSLSGRERWKIHPIHARIGASRAFIDANVPWEYVTPRNLAAGLGPRYRVIYLPAEIAISEDLQKDLEAFVRQGGRLVMDLPGAQFDAYGRILPTRPGTWFERVFGAVMHEFDFGNPHHTTFSIDGVLTPDFTAAMTPTTATVLAEYDGRGGAAITEHRLGDGTAVILGCEAARHCLRPGNQPMQDLLVRHALGVLDPGFICTGALAYRRAAPQADHWFLINPEDAPARAVLRITEPDWPATAATDVLTGAAVDLTAPIAIDGQSGRWLRVARDR